MEPVRLRLVFPSRRRILSKSEQDLSKSWFLLNPQLHPTVADVSSQITNFFNLNHSCPYGISLSMDGFVLPPYESSSILKDKDLVRVKRKKEKTSSEIVDKDGVNLIEGDDVANNPICTDVLLLDNGTGVHQIELEEGEINLVEELQLVDQPTGQDSGSKKRKKSKKDRNEKVKRKGKTPVQAADVADGIESTRKEEILEKEHIDTGLLNTANEEFKKEINVNQDKFQEKEDNLIKGSLLEENSVVKEVVSKKRKASEELESPKKKKKQAGWLYRFFETGDQDELDELSPKREKGKSSMAQQDTERDILVEKNEPNQSNDLSSEMNVDNIEEVYDLVNKHQKKNASTSSGGNYEIVEPRPIPNSVLQESGAKSDGVPQTSKGTKKLCRGSLKQYKMRKLRKELKAEAKELLAENVLVRSSIRNLATRSVKRQQHNQNSGVFKPQHIRFEPYEKEEKANKDQVAEETREPSETISNQKLGQERRVYCTRSNYKKSGEECLQVVTLEKENAEKDAEFNKLPLLSSCPKEGDIIAYRVLEQSPETGPILSSFRVGKALRLDNWARMLILTPVEENPVAPEKSDIDLEEQKKSETGACQQQKDKPDANAWEQKQDKSDTNDGDQGKSKSDTNAWEQKQSRSDTGGWAQKQGKSNANAWEKKKDISDTGGWEKQKDKSDANAWEQKQDKSDTNAWDQGKSKSDTNAWEQKQTRSDTGGWGQRQGKSDTNAWEEGKNRSDNGGWEKQKNEFVTNAWEQKQNKSDTVGWEQQKGESDTTNAWEQKQNRSDTNAWEQQKGKSYTNAWEPWKNRSDTNAWGKQQKKSDTVGWEQWKKKSVTNACEQIKHKSDTGGWVRQENKSDTGAWEQPKMDYVDKESGHIEIDIETLYDVRIVKHSSLPEKVVDKWDSISQTADLRNALLTKRREWGRGGPTANSNNQQWAKVGPTETSTKQEWAKVGPTTKSGRKNWGKEGNNVGSNTSLWSSKPFNKIAKQEWVKKGPTTWKKELSNEKKDWGKGGRTRDTWKKEWSNAGPNAKKEWGKVNPKEGSNLGPTTSSWSSKQFEN